MGQELFSTTSAKGETCRGRGGNRSGRLLKMLLSYVESVRVRDPQSQIRESAETARHSPQLGAVRWEPRAMACHKEAR